MTDKELDEFLIQTLKKILAEVKDCADYVKNQNSEEYDEIKEDYVQMIDDLSSVLKKVRTIEDLAEMDEDTIGCVFEYLDEYTSNLVISAEEPQKSKDEAEYSKLQELLNLFFDDDDEDDNFDDEEDQ